MARAVSRDGLHALLWMDSDKGVIRIHQHRLARELLVKAETVNRLLKTLELDGRIRSLSPTRGSRLRVYEVQDPAEWFMDQGPRS